LLSFSLPFAFLHASSFDAARPLRCHFDISFSARYRRFHYHTRHAAAAAISHIFAAILHFIFAISDAAIDISMPPIIFIFFRFLHITPDFHATLSLSSADIIFRYAAFAMLLLMPMPHMPCRHLPLPPICHLLLRY